VSVVARQVASVPRRTSVETWQRVVELVSAPDSDARVELEGVTSVAATLIADEQTKTAPITIAGGGPLVRVYTLHGEDAIEADLDDEDEFAFNPTAGNSWLLSLPATGPDLAAAEGLLAGAPHVEARDPDQAERPAEGRAKAGTGDLVLDLEELARP
jgi:hypothetical protein